MTRKSNVNACYYCGALNTKISRHYLNFEGDKEEIKLLQQLPPGCECDERKTELERLRLLGNFKPTAKYSAMK